VLTGPLSAWKSWFVLCRAATSDLMNATYLKRREMLRLLVGLALVRFSHVGACGSLPDDAVEDALLRMARRLFRPSTHATRNSPKQ
jgi:hypothetical protein